MTLCLCIPDLIFVPQQLTFEEDLKITSMFSGEGENVPFCQDLYPTGNVEDWLLEVERIMRESLRELLDRSLKVYPEVGVLSL